MPRATSKLTDESDRLWAAHFAEALRIKERRPVGPGWLTAAEILAKMKGAGQPMGKSRLREMLRVNMADGTMEIFRGLMVSEKSKNKPLAPQIWYRPIAIPKKKKAFSH